MSTSSSQRGAIWSSFVEKWYNAPLWGDMKRRKPKLYRNMVRNRIASLDMRGKDISAVLRDSSPGRQNTVNWNIINTGSTLILAGELDTKYVEIGMQWASLFPELSFATIANSGHALLVEDSDAVANAILKFITESKATKKSKGPQDGKSRAAFPNVTSIPVGDNKRASEQGRAPSFVVVSREENATEKLQSSTFKSKAIGGLDFEAFSIAMIGDDKESGVRGIGWGEKAAADTRMQQRSGFILQLVSEDRSIVGIGEVSPLTGLHPESLVDAKKEIVALQKRLEGSKNIPVMLEDDILAMQGGLNSYIQALCKALSINALSPSVKSGLEMALLSFAAQIKRLPVLSAISASGNALALNGLLMRGSSQRAKNEPSIRYSSLKVKVGHQSAQDDAAALTRALQDTLKDGKIRADANRAWDDGRAIEFASALEVLDVNVVRRIEFVEEPLQKVQGSKWSIRSQIAALERWYQHTGIKYALDESIVDLVADHSGDFGSIAAELESIFEEGIFGCAALVLKPALLGLELSMQISRLANSSLGVGTVFSSSFDSGVGLAYAAFLAAATEPRYAHGIGTFSMLAGDTLSPSFGSYVNDKGFLQVASLSRALFGLGLDEMRGSFSAVLPEEEPTDDKDNYQASTATSSSGRELSVVVSLPLPFSDMIASSRFTDLPQQSRWSPWLSSVAYLDAGRETEWTLNVRGVRFSWRAVSDILETPYRGIQWESISGLGNLGVVEFIPTAPEACLMKVRMTILVPRLLATLFPGASVFLEDFLQNKLLKWSLEMFRDVVKGDLALERGDVELGDALFGAVEGRANAIEATLSLPPMSEPGSGSVIGE
jgi:o-succinylbenzoate synthase